MGRSILDEGQSTPRSARPSPTTRRTPCAKVQTAIASHDVVVAGMAQNPFPKKACKALDARGIPYTYLEYGSYLSGWRRRSALKMWTGWPTFPMVFVKACWSAVQAMWPH
jgi:monothiol glutaredoxin